MKDNLWLKLINLSETNEWNLICFPYAGGYAEYFLPWREYVSEKIGLCPIQLPGRSYRYRENICVQIESLISNMLESIEPLLYLRPYCLFGHSMGGYIAYELAKTIALNGLPLPRNLFVSSIPSPTYWPSQRKLSEFSMEEFQELFLNLGGFHPKLLEQKKFMQLQWLLLRQDIQLCESCCYLGSANLPFPITCFGASDDEYVNASTLYDWKKETSENFTSHLFKGGHFYLNHEFPQILRIVDQEVKCV